MREDKTDKKNTNKTLISLTYVDKFVELLYANAHTYTDTYIMIQKHTHIHIIAVSRYYF